MEGSLGHVTYPLTEPHLFSGLENSPTWLGPDD